MKITKEINPYIFRGYDIRGVYPTDLTEDIAYTIGRSFGSKLIDLGKKECIIGHDNRLSSPVLYHGLMEGILDSGVSVVSLGLVTTPMYYYACIHENIDCGVMVTASHNPKDENGFKFAFDASGNACGQTIQDFYTYTEAGGFHTGRGSVRDLLIVDDYIAALLQNITCGSRPLKVIVDCGNGTTSLFARKLFSKLPIDLTVLFEESDATFPNHHPDPAVEENLTALKEAVLAQKADVGIAFDGDGDRIGVIDELGQYIPGDLFMILMIRDILPKSENKRVLYDVKCSKALPDEVSRLGGMPLPSRVGNSYTKRNTRDWNCIFGGELSGHVYFRDKFYGFDSGMYAGLRLVERLTHTTKSVSELLAGIPKYYATPEIKIATPDAIKFQVVDRIKAYAEGKHYDINDIDGVRLTFTDGWAGIRASNTGPNITARFEATTKERRDQLQMEFLPLIEKWSKEETK